MSSAEMDALRDTLVAMLTGEAPKTTKFHNVGVEYSPDARKIMLPKGMTAKEGVVWLTRFDQEQETDVSIVSTIDAFPLDGAVAFMSVLGDIFGWTSMAPAGFWQSPPTMVEVKTSPTETRYVPWGKVLIPGFEGYLTTGFTIQGKRTIFQLNGVVKRKQEELAREIAQKVREKVRQSSIYRGKAIEINFRDQDGELKEFTPDDNPNFIDVSKVVEEELIFPKLTQQLFETTLFTLIEHSQACRDAKIPLKRGILLERPYGTGKTLAANVIAKKCQENGWTFIYVKDVRDLDLALGLGESYSPAVVFGEDIDRAVGMERNTEIDRILNALDGVVTKHTEIITILTTNNIEGINRAMIRPGRIDTVIPVRAPDGEAAVRLIKVYGRDLIDGDNEDIEEALKPILGANAAALREVVERAKLAAVHRTKGVGQLIIDPTDLALAAESLKYHMELLKEKKAPDNRPMSVFGEAVGLQLRKALKVASWGGEISEIALEAANGGE